MKDNKSFQQQVTKIKSPINEAKGRVRQIAAIIASVTGLLGISGVASGVTVLNALGKGESTYQRLDQESFFNGVAQSVRSPYLVTFFGMSLDELAALVQSHNRTVETYHASSTTLEQFRTQAKANLKHDKDFIIVNYDRSQIGQTGEGHISPIAAYSEKMDKFLVMDVSTYKYPPVWVSAPTLWAAMNTSDVVTNKTRGYLIVKR